MHYQEQALAGATGVDLIVSLYDGWLRFLYRATRAAEEDDVIERRYAIKRALDILMYLQARLRMDCGSPAVALNDFYAAMFTMTLEASRANSAAQLHEVIACVRKVREAWIAVARDPRQTACCHASCAPPESGCSVHCPPRSTRQGQRWKRVSAFVFPCSQRCTQVWAQALPRVRTLPAERHIR